MSGCRGRIFGAVITSLAPLSAFSADNLSDAVASMLLSQADSLQVGVEENDDSSFDNSEQSSVDSSVGSHSPENLSLSESTFLDKIKGAFTANDDFWNFGNLADNLIARRQKINAILELMGMRNHRLSLLIRAILDLRMRTGSDLDLNIAFYHYVEIAQSIKGKEFSVEDIRDLEKEASEGHFEGLSENQNTFLSLAAATEIKGAKLVLGFDLARRRVNKFITLSAIADYQGSEAYNQTFAAELDQESEFMMQDTALVRATARSLGRHPSIEDLRDIASDRCDVVADHFPIYQKVTMGGTLPGADREDLSNVEEFDQVFKDLLFYSVKLRRPRADTDSPSIKRSGLYLRGEYDLLAERAGYHTQQVDETFLQQLRTIRNLGASHNWSEPLNDGHLKAGGLF